MENFLQSSEWEQFQKSLGRKTWRINSILVVQHDLPFGFNYLYCPRPVDVHDIFLAATEEVAKKERSIFLKIDPIRELRIKNYELSIKKSDSIQPQKTVVLDLTKFEDELLAAMHEKTRYNIRLAERHNVRIKSYELGITGKHFGAFWNLLHTTAQRDGFSTHEREYYEKLLQGRSEQFSNELFFAEYQGKPLAAAVVNFYKLSYETGSHKIRVATYLHGASSREYREVMAPHLLHWRIIQEAKRHGFQKYDFWGIDDKKWPGLTRFKKGFGGDVVEYPSTVDIIYHPILYRMYRIAKNVV